MTNAYCAHLRISWRTKDVEYDGPDGTPVAGSPNVPIKHGAILTTGWWECDFGCGRRFNPIASAAPATGEASDVTEKLESRVDLHRTETQPEKEGLAPLHHPAVATGEASEPPRFSEYPIVAEIDTLLDDVASSAALMKLWGTYKSGEALKIVTEARRDYDEARRKILAKVLWICAMRKGEGQVLSQVLDYLEIANRRGDELAAHIRARKVDE